MRVAGQATLDAERESIWPLIFDPGALLELLPGCEDVQQTESGDYQARLNLRVPAIAGSYQAKVRVLESNPPGFCRFEGEASGPAGSIVGQARFTLIEEGPATRIDYEGDARISGALAGMNPRFAEGIAKTFISQGLGKLPAMVEARKATEPVAAPEARRSGLRALVARARAWLARLFRRTT